VHLERRARLNLSDTPRLGKPNGSFGGIATAGDPRVFELALRLKF
jgi:hypothetical protein